MATSYSKLSTYEGCHLKYKFRYKDNIRTPKGPAAQRGTDLHGSAEGYLLGQKNTIRKELVPIKQVLLLVKKQEPFVEQKVSLREDLLRVCDWDAKEAYLHMVLDSAYINGNEVHVQEWKSGKVYPDHADQRRVYALGALAQWTAMQEVTVTTYYIDQGVKKTLRIDRSQRTLLVGEYLPRFKAMENEKRFTPNPGRQCYWCDYSRRKGGPCPAG
jgi:hypothetical protein